jgi:hypothetical protein
MQGFLSDNLFSAFRADPELEAVFLVVNADGYPPNQAAGYHREQILTGSFAEPSARRPARR